MPKDHLIACLILIFSTLTHAQSTQPDWIEPMRKVHAGFTGQAGYVAQFGDSITYSMAFWSPMNWSEPDPYLKEDGLPKHPGKRWRDIIKGAGQEGKGPAQGNYSGWRISDVLKAAPRVLAERRPEVALVMVGTNDISGGSLPPDYQPGLEKLVQLCLDAHCIPVLNTIPPRRDRMSAVEAANKVIKEVASKNNVPLVDYCAAIIERAPDGKWDGTLVSGDGVHPSGGDNHVYTEDNLRKSGYALRNWVNFLMYREIYFKVFNHDRNWRE